MAVTTNNPAIRSVLAGARAQEAAAAGMRAGDTDRIITIDDIVVKTFLSLCVVVVSAFATVLAGLELLAVPAFAIALAIALYLMFRPRPSAVLTLAYAAAEGVVLGAATQVFEAVHPGIGVQAVLCTSGVFASMLLAYRLRIVRVHVSKVGRWGIGVMLGIAALILGELVAATVFDAELGLRDGDLLSIGFGLLSIAAASFSLLLNFDAADELLNQGAAARWAWSLAFGLTMALVWLYIEFLWLRSYD